MPNFNRIARVTVGPAGGTGFSWEGFDLDFTVVKTNTSEPNKCELTLYNLAEESRAFLLGDGLDLILEAGYSEGEGLRVIFRGNVDLVTHDTVSETFTTKIQALDGKRARARRLSKSYSPGTSRTVIVNDLLAALGVPQGNVDLSALTGQRVEGQLISGRAGDYLDQLLASAGLVWSIQDGVVRVYPEGSTVGGLGPLISPDTILVGAPQRVIEETPDGRRIKGLQVVTTLDTLAAPGQRVQLESEAYSGVYRTRRVEHRGAIDGADWFTLRDLVE